MDKTIRYIAKTYAKPFVNPNSELYIEWCGECLKVLGITEYGAWVVERELPNHY